MNYRHAFHAGNRGDCLKHALLVVLLRALQRKPAPIFVLDTHAGAGTYDLAGEAAGRTGEWRDGIGRLIDDPPAALAAYVGIVDRLGLYPGSPALVRAMLRPGDRMACCELHPEDHAALRRHLAGDRQAGVHHRDGWEALGGLLPPQERRGLVLIDPPYEAPDEFARVIEGLRRGHARFPTGVFAAWYPIKRLAMLRGFMADLATCGIRDIVDARLWWRPAGDLARLNGAGVVVVNPPYRFEEEAGIVLDALLERLGGDDPGRGARVTRIVDE